MASGILTKSMPAKRCSFLTALPILGVAAILAMIGAQIGAVVIAAGMTAAVTGAMRNQIGVVVTAAGITAAATGAMKDPIGPIIAAGITAGKSRFVIIVARVVKPATTAMTSPVTFTGRLFPKSSTAIPAVITLTAGRIRFSQI